MTEFLTTESAAIAEMIEKGRRIEGRHVEALCLADMKFTQRASFLNCRFGSVDFARAHFDRGLSFVLCRFDGAAQFTGCRIERDCEFRAVTFGGRSSFENVYVGGNLEMRSPGEQHDHEAMRAAIARIRDAQPHDDDRPSLYARFEDLVRFHRLEVKGEANLAGAQFYRWADFFKIKTGGAFLLRRDRAQGIMSGLHFPPPRFYGGVSFRNAEIGDELNLTGAKIWGKADFTYADVKGATFFGNPDTMHDPSVVASATVFHDRPLWRARRYSDDRPDAEVTLEKRRTDPDEPAAFAFEIAAPIVKPMKFAEHALSHEGNVVRYRNEELACIAEFDNAEFRGGLYIADDAFQRQTTFRDTTYGRIEMWHDTKPNIKHLISRFCDAEDARRQFEGSSWLQLERTLRRNGRIRTADDVYRQRMSRELKWEPGFPAGCERLLRRVWSALSGYGTLPGRVVAWSLGVIWLFSLVFAGLGLDTAAALRESVTSFLPFQLPLTAVQPSKAVPVPGVLEASERLLGWFLVPALAATLLSALRRRANDASQ
jgi:uncharacterized protein YjbI with pentapeptide repeats